jgi:hypothetical protein
VADEPESTPYLTVDEFACLSTLSEVTVRRYLRDGRLPKFQPGGDRCRIGIPVSALQTLEPAQSVRPVGLDSAPSTDAQSLNQLSINKKLPGRRPRWRRDV